MNCIREYFLPYQCDWVFDRSPLKIMEKSRQIGITYADAYDSVIKASTRMGGLDVWVSSRDEVQAKLYLEDCKHWANFLHLTAIDLGVVILDPKTHASAYVLQFANHRRIYCLSSNPNALAGKRGHVKLDEFALQQDQRLLYRVAKPVTTWGGTLSIISTHRGVGSVFNEIIREIKESGNPMGWSLHTVPIQKAIDQGIVERINQKTGRNESRSYFAKRTEAECLDPEQWAQEYCCQPADESSAFLGYDLIQPCEADCMKDFDYLLACQNRLLLGVDIGRVKDLTVMDVGEQIGDVTWDRFRLELHNTPFAQQRAELYRFLELPKLVRACVDSHGLGNQLAEEARQKFGWKVEPIHPTAPLKEQMAYNLRAAFEDRRLRIDRDPKLREDLRGIKKEVTASGNIRFDGSCDDSHCDRFWAKALRQHALSRRREAGGAVA
jgi:phage FluMu gp28-like protein